MLGKKLVRSGQSIGALGTELLGFGRETENLSGNREREEDKNERFV